MLLARSISLQLFIVFSIALVSKAQDHEYAVDDEDESSDFTEGDRPDYSKYYSVDGSTPPKAAGAAKFTFGFTQPQEFAGFFAPQETLFGASAIQKATVPAVNQFSTASNNIFVPANTKFPFADQSTKPFGGKDYFEEAQSKQRQEEQDYPSGNYKDSSEEDTEHNPKYENEDIKFGPNYVSHQIAPKLKQASEIIPKQHLSQYDNNKDKLSDIDFYKNLGSQNKYTDYNSGKSSSTLSQFPQAPGYSPSNASKQKANLLPYKKFSFQQPSDITTAANQNNNGFVPYNPGYQKLITPDVSNQAEQTKTVPSKVKSNNCHQVIKKGNSEESQDLTCTVCVDPQTSARQTECSYASEPVSKSLYEGNSERYSIPAREPGGFRYKRFSESEEENDPYEYVKQQSLKEQDHDKEESDKEQYNYDADYDYQPDKSFSESQSEQIAKHPENCQKVDRDGMTCTVCKDSKTGGNYEQCSYTHNAKPEKYAYVSEKEYNSEDDPEAESETDETKNVPLKQEKVEHRSNDSEKDEIKRGRSKGEKSRFPSEAPEYNNQRKKPRNKPKNRVTTYSNRINTKKPIDERPDYEPEENRKNEKVSKDNDFYGGVHQDDSPYSNVDDYHFKYFPEYAKEESQVKEHPAKYDDFDSKTDVSEVLQEFRKKDRSACKEVQKKGMTCYLCVDKKGIKNEECMYVSESKPVSKFVGYKKTENKGLADNGDKQKTEESKQNATTLEVAASNENFVKTKAPKKYLKSLEYQKTIREPVPQASAYGAERITKKKATDEPEFKDPEEIVSGEDGAYSAETKPVYSKTLGLLLPRYMVEKSDFEKEFDAAAHF